MDDVADFLDQADGLLLVEHVLVLVAAIHRDGIAVVGEHGLGLALGRRCRGPVLALRAAWGAGWSVKRDVGEEDRREVGDLLSVVLVDKTRLVLEVGLVELFNPVVQLNLGNLSPQKPQLLLHSLLFRPLHLVDKVFRGFVNRLHILPGNLRQASRTHRHRVHRNKRMVSNHIHPVSLAKVCLEPVPHRKLDLRSKPQVMVPRQAGN